MGRFPLARVQFFVTDCPRVARVARVAQSPRLVLEWRRVRYPSDSMLHFPLALAAWSGPDFKSVLKAEIEALDPALLPLQAALTQTSHVGDRPLGATILSVEESGGCLRVKAGLFFSGIIAGCSCADDPTPVDEISEYGEVLFEIDPASGKASVRLLDG